jgi:hypothetical protein
MCVQTLRRIENNLNQHIELGESQIQIRTTNFSISMYNSYLGRIMKTDVHMYCDMWAVSRKRVGKNVAMETLTPGNQLITEQGYGN